MAHPCRTLVVCLAVVGVVSLPACSQATVRDGAAPPTTPQDVPTGPTNPDPTSNLPTEPTETAEPTSDEPTEPVTQTPTGPPSTEANFPDLSGNEIDCSSVSGPCDYGDDPTLDSYWDSCAAGDGGGCDRLYYDSGFDTRYEQFGNTCGDRGMVTPCHDRDLRG